MIVFILLALPAIWLGASYFVASRLTHRSQKPFAEPIIVCDDVTPLELRLLTSDGESLGGWYFNGNPEFPIVLLLHGNDGCRSACLSEAKLLIDAGYPVMMISQRAHGDSSGNLNDFGYSARHDVVAAVSWIEQHDSNHKIVIWGQSLGSAAAVFAAPEFGPVVAGYILECPYQDLQTAMDRRLIHYLPIVVRDVAGAGLKIVAPFVLPDWSKISPLQAAGKIPSGTPVLVMSGECDTRAFPEEGQAIAKKVGLEAEFHSMPGAEHLGLLRTDREMYRTWIIGFLQRIAR